MLQILLQLILLNATINLHPLHLVVELGMDKDEVGLVPGCPEGSRGFPKAGTSYYYNFNF